MTRATIVSLIAGNKNKTKKISLISLYHLTPQMVISSTEIVNAHVIATVEDIFCE